MTAHVTARIPVSISNPPRGSPFRDSMTHDLMTLTQLKYGVEYTYGTPMSVLPSFAERKCSVGVLFPKDDSRFVTPVK